MNRTARVLCLLFVAGAINWFASYLAQPKSKGSFPSHIEKRLTKQATDQERDLAAAKVNLAWDRIEAKLTEIEPTILNGLRPPASDHDIQSLQDRLGFHLPADLEASLRRHNGSTEPFGVFWLFSTTGIVRQCAHETQQSIDDWPAEFWENLFRHEQGYWEPGALVVGRNHFALLVDIEDGGITLIQSDHSYSGPHHDSFLNYLEYLANALETGEFEIAEHETQGLPPKSFFIHGWGCEHY